MAMTESEIVDTCLRYLSVGIDHRQVIEFAVSGGKLIGFQMGGEVATKSLDDLIQKTKAESLIATG